MKLQVIELPTMRPSFALLFSQVLGADLEAGEADRLRQFGREAGAAATLIMSDELEVAYGYEESGVDLADLLQQRQLEPEAAAPAGDFHDYSDGPPVPPMGDEEGAVDLDAVRRPSDVDGELAERRRRGIGGSWGAPSGVDD